MALTHREQRAERTRGPRVHAPAEALVRRRIPELAVGVILMGLCALGALVLFSDNTAPTQVVALGSTVEGGTTIEAADLVSIGLSSDSVTPVNAIRWDDVDSIIGRSAVVTLQAGTLPTTDLLQGEIPIPPDMRAVGVVLTPGGVPEVSLAAGDFVDVIWADPRSPRTIVDSAQVSSVLRAGNEYFVTVIVPRDDEADTAAAAQAGQLRLARLAR